MLAITTDIVLFSIHEERLQVLLVAQEQDDWRLPGGDVVHTEDLDASARRHLEQQTGVQDVYLEQLYTFGRPERHSEKRLISVAYYALVPAEQLRFQHDHRPAERPWFPVGALPALMLDHAEIIRLAHRRLAGKLAYSTIALQFMPEQFTLSALQSVYETILGASLDKRNFRKRLLTMGCIEETSQRVRVGNHRPARLYRARDPGRVEFIR